jgi:hypothetical protein
MHLGVGDPPTDEDDVALVALELLGVAHARTSVLPLVQREP